MMNDSSKKSRKNARKKIRMLTTIRKPSCPPGRFDEQVLDPDVAVDAVERQAEHARADQDEHDERGELGRRVHRLLQELPRQPPARERHDQCAGRAHRAAFGRRGHAQEDRAQHEEDQRQHRDQHEDDAFGQLRQELEPEQLAEQRGEECHRRTDGRGNDDHLVQRRIGREVPLCEDNRGDDRQDDEHEQRTRAGVAVGLLQRARFHAAAPEPTRASRRRRPLHRARRCPPARCPE